MSKKDDEQKLRDNFVCAYDDTNAGSYGPQATVVMDNGCTYSCEDGGSAGGLWVHIPSEKSLSDYPTQKPRQILANAVCVVKADDGTKRLYSEGSVVWDKNKKRYVVCEAPKWVPYNGAVCKDSDS